MGWEISWTIPNWWTTWSSVCFSTRWKHISDTIAVHTTLPATQYVGRSLNSASYSYHTTYNGQNTRRQHVRQLSISSSNRQLQCVYFKVHQSYILFLNMSKTHFGIWSSSIEAICSWYESKKTLEGLFFLLGSHNHIQSKTRGSISTTFLQTYSYD